MPELTVAVCVPGSGGANSRSRERCSSSEGASSTAWIGGASASGADGAAGAPERPAIDPHPATTSNAARPSRRLTAPV